MSTMHKTAMQRTTRQRKTRMMVVALCLGGVAMAQAQVAPPRAGQSLRELETTPPAPPPADVAPLPVPAQPATPAPAAAGNAFTVTVKTFALQGNSALSNEELLPLLADFTNKPLTLAQLQEAAGRITGKYQQEGWLLARAFVGAQEVQDGSITITVVEGRYGQVSVKNDSRIPERTVTALTRNLKNGDAVKAVPLEKSLLLLDDLPGTKVNSSLAAGSEVGTSDLALSVQQDKRVEGGMSLDNYGNSYNGAWRLNGDITLNNPFNTADSLSLRALISDEAQHYLRGQYEITFGPWATRAGAAFSWMDYELAKDFEALEASGDASTASLYISQPWWRQRQYGFSTQLGLDQKTLNDETGLFGLESEKSLSNINLVLSGYWRDDLWAGAATSYSLGWIVGDLSLDSRDAQVQDILTRSEGKFQKWMPALYRQQFLASNLSLVLQLRGQFASGNLDSAEKISLGGASGVRAYPEGEASGDEGWVGNAELRYALDEKWQAGFFLDAGGVTVNKDPVPLAGENKRDLGGLGLAAYWQPDAHWQATVTAAWPLSDEEPTSDTPRGHYIWGQLAWRY